MKITGPLVDSGHQWGGGKRDVLYGTQNVSDLMSKKKILTLITELAAILNHLGLTQL